MPTKFGGRAHHDNPPRRCDIRGSGSNKQAELIRLALPNELPPHLTQLLRDKQARHGLEYDEERARVRENGPPP